MSDVATDLLYLHWLMLGPTASYTVGLVALSPGV